MGAYMNRKAAMHWGIKWPSDIAFKEVHDRRRERQARRLADIRRIPKPQYQPCYAWIFHNKFWLYGGWYCYVMTHRQRIAVNFQGFDRDLAISLMAEINVGVLPDAANFEMWMKAATKQYPRRQNKDTRQAGSIIGWLQDNRTFTRHRPHRPQ